MATITEIKGIKNNQIYGVNPLKEKVPEGTF